MNTGTWCMYTTTVEAEYAQYVRDHYIAKGMTISRDETVDGVTTIEAVTPWSKRRTLLPILHKRTKEQNEFR